MAMMTRELLGAEAVRLHQNVRRMIMCESWNLCTT